MFWKYLQNHEGRDREENVTLRFLSAGVISDTAFAMPRMSARDRSSRAVANCLWESDIQPADVVVVEITRSSVGSETECGGALPGRPTANDIAPTYNERRRA